jgi:hypothetical protein
VRGRGSVAAGELSVCVDGLLQLLLFGPSAVAELYSENTHTHTLPNMKSNIDYCVIDSIYIESHFLVVDLLQYTLFILPQRCLYRV